MQIEMIQEWIEKVRVGLDGASEGGCGSGEERVLWEWDGLVWGLWWGSEELAVISLKD